MESNDRLLSVRELASLLNMSVPWVYKQCEKSEKGVEGLLPFVRLGEAIRFDPGAIKAYLESRRNLKGGKNGD